MGDLVQRRGEGFGVSGQQAAVFVGVVFARAGDGHLDQGGGDRRENHAQQRADQAESAGIVAIIAPVVAEVHQGVAQVGDDGGHGGGDGGGQDVTVVHVHEFMAQHAAQFAGVEYLEDSLSAAYGRMPFVASGGEGVRTHGGGDVDARHGLAGLGAQFAHDLVDFGGFLFADFPRAHGGDGEFVGKPVGAERGDQSDDDIDAQRLPAAARGPPDEHDDGPHQGKEQRRFQAVEVAVHPYFGIHTAHTKVAG